MMKTNEELQKDVQNAIKWEPLLAAAEIGVIAKDGVISLSGVVDSYAKKLEAENAAKKVLGVRGLVEKIEVKYPSDWIKTSVEIANEVLLALNSHWMVPKNRVTVQVENGWVTLEGDLSWNFQRNAAIASVNLVTGIVGVTNNIKIKSESKVEIQKVDIENAICRSLSIDDNCLSVKVAGTTVTLIGSVNSWYQREEAERITWNTPGIGDVINELSVDYKYSYT